MKAGTRTMLVSALLGAATCSVQVVHASTITVSSTANSGAGTLRTALASVANGDTIIFSVATPATITLTTGELVVSNNVSILGLGPGNLKINGNAAGRVFHITSGRVVTIASLTVTNGLLTSFVQPDDFGAGIYNDHATLTVSNCTVSGNYNTYDRGGGILNDGGSGSATLTIINSTVSANTCEQGGGAGISNLTGPGSATLTINGSTLSGNSCLNSVGGGIRNEVFEGNATVTISNCTLTGNKGFSGAGLGIETYPNGTSTVTVVASTISSNYTTTESITPGNPGGGIFHSANGVSTLRVINSTFSYNSAYKSGGGIYNVSSSPPASEANLTVLGCTFSDNFIDDIFEFDSGGAAIYNEGYSGSGSTTTLEIGDTILRRSSSSYDTILNRNGGVVITDGYNLSNNNGGGVLTNATDLINTNPQLGPLADNGGPTATHALLTNSPAIDRGKSFGQTTDQRGRPRPVDDPAITNAVSGDGSDIGAYEVQTTSVDSVGDGIPNTWRAQYFGGSGATTNSQSCATCDPDGDGFSNAQEFPAGFNPINSAVYPRVLSIVPAGNDIKVTYLGANGDSTWSPGIGSRTNVLEFTTGAAGGSASNNFASTGQTNILSGGTGLGVVTNMVDSGGATNVPSRYYRVRVLVP
jgi:hypothetical protein